MSRDATTRAHGSSAYAPRALEPIALARAVLEHHRPSIARALNLLDDERPRAQASARELLAHLPNPCDCPNAQLLGLTGPPGVGKSSLVAALISEWRSSNLRVAVLAVDPSSPKTGGALLGDRLRMRRDFADEGAFIRSLANRNTYGGLAPHVLPMACVMLAAFDRVIIETVGVGQREVDIASLADTTALVVQPGAGDAVQLLKAGIMEVPDLLVVNKSDLGAIAERTRSDLTAMFGGASGNFGEASGDFGEARHDKVMATSATEHAGINALAQAFNARHTTLGATSTLARLRAKAQTTWLVSQIQREYGERGLALLGGEPSIADINSPSQSSVLERLALLRTQAEALFISAPQTKTTNFDTHSRGDVFAPPSSQNSTDFGSSS
jgi:LAO/AO transport system kinase